MGAAIGDFRVNKLEINVEEIDLNDGSSDSSNYEDSNYEDSADNWSDQDLEDLSERKGGLQMIGNN